MSKKWRICFVAPGDSAHTKRWVEAMSERGHQVLLVTKQPFLSRRVSVYNPYERMGRWRVPKLHHLACHVMVDRAIRAFRPNLVHMHWLEGTPSMIRLANHWERLVISVWGRDVVWDADRPEPAARIRRKKRLLAAAQEITATSQFLADKTIPLLARGRRISKIPFGIDTGRFSPATDKPHTNNLLIGFTKHFRPKYGGDVLIQSMTYVRKKCPRARLIMMGDDNPTPYRQLVETLALTDVVTIRDPLDHDAMPDMMRTFDIFCMPSVYESETFGVAALEASACGVPVVATSVGGVREAVKDGVTGILVEPRDARALAEALIELAHDSERASRMGRAGRQFVVEQYQWCSSVSAMEDVYDRLMQSPAQPGSEG